MRDTIFAPATAPGRAAVAIVRISGPAAAGALERLAGARPRARRASLRRLRDPDGAAIDEALVLWLPGPGSYTGEDMAELQVHGSAAVVDAVTDALLAMGLRLAEPGEFTRRAFEAGRLDLDQAEAVADLIDAQTRAQARQALEQLEGALGRRYRGWRAMLAEALALVEAAVDFPDEELPQDVALRAGPLVGALSAQLAAALADAGRGQWVREGYRIALVGAPNAGKSQLFNALLGREAAIVTPTPGTTRDVIEAPLALGAYRAVIADMAGLRATDDAIEGEGVRRACAWAADAALRLWVVDGAASTGDWREARATAAPGDILVIAKSDLGRGRDAAEAMGAATCARLEVAEVSAEDGRGLGALMAAVRTRAEAALSGSDFPAATRARHARALAEALERLRGVDAERLAAPELAAEELRLAARALERITGRIGAEDVLGVIFSSFCIGK